MARLHLIHRTGLALQAELLVAGMHCSFATDSSAVLDSVSRWKCTGRHRTGRTVEMNVHLDESLPRDRGPRPQPEFRGLRHLVFATVGAHEVFVLDLLRKQATGVVSPASANDAAFWSTQWLPTIAGVMEMVAVTAPPESARLDFDGQNFRRFAPTPLRVHEHLESADVLLETNDLSFLSSLTRVGSTTASSSGQLCLWKIVRDVDVRGKATDASIIMAGSLIVFSMGPACIIGADRERKEILAFIGLDVDARTFQESIFPTLRRLTEFVMREAGAREPVLNSEVAIAQPCNV
jgi:hypothetical protein